MSTINVNNIDKESGSTLTIGGSGTTVNVSNMVPDVSLSNRNLIINGAMNVAQRATSVTGITTNGYQTLDRYRFTASGATFNSSQQTLTLGQTDIPSQFKYFQRFEVTTGNDQAGITQRIEDVEIISDQNVTVSFYAKGTNPGGGSVEVELTQVFGSGGSSSVSVTDTITLTSSWQRFEKTLTLASLSGKTIGTGNYLVLKIGQGADTSTNAWTLDITGLQLEAGNVATPFEHESYGQTLAKCQRYYTKSYDHDDVPGTNTEVGAIYNRGSSADSVTNRTVNISFPVEMRSNPTCVAYSISGTSGAISDCSVAFSEVSVLTGSSFSGTQGRRSLSKISAGSSVNSVIALHFTADAEL